eukprot:GHVL01033223.1.p1 GENE.GHVL01033223.1~~GHVL01033223.1.p1  ORF type:complete len:113 (+),score=11.59 GHVL01033223.1:34-339(+)
MSVRRVERILLTTPATLFKCIVSAECSMHDSDILEKFHERYLPEIKYNNVKFKYKVISEKPDRLRLHFSDRTFLDLNPHLYGSCANFYQRIIDTDLQKSYN